MYILPKLVLFLSYLYIAKCTEIKSSEDALNYLRQFGYLPTDNENLQQPHDEKEMFAHGISVFQMFAGISQTMEFDNDTMQMMNQPRCGMAERMEIMENKNINMRTLSHKIKIPRSRKWKASTIYYKIANIPASLEIEPSLAKEEIRKAFRLWEEVANIKCIEIDTEDGKKAEIDIMFVTKEHGDGNAFGQQAFANVVAHAFFPDHRHFEGDVHFDNERMWTAFVRSGINLFQVAAHEIGHALGLDHSRFPDSVMHMIVKSEFKNSFQLHDDDIQGIQKLYGPRKHRREWAIKTAAFEHNKDISQATVTAKTEPQLNALNINEVIGVPMSASEVSSELTPILRNFWKCFSISERHYRKNLDDATNCYKQNIVKLLYSLKIL